MQRNRKRVHPGYIVVALSTNCEHRGTGVVVTAQCHFGLLEFRYQNMNYLVCRGECVKSPDTLNKDLRIHQKKFVRWLNKKKILTLKTVRTLSSTLKGKSKTQTFEFVFGIHFKFSCIMFWSCPSSNVNGIQEE